MRASTIIVWTASIASIGVAVRDAHRESERTRAVLDELPHEMRQDAYDCIRLATIERLSDLDAFADALASKGYQATADLARARAQELKEQAA